MGVKAYLALLSCLLLVLCGAVYGVKFLRKRNYLLGFEWLIVAFSGSNLLSWMLVQTNFPAVGKINYSISFFLDAFSRGFGIPIVAVLGLMAVTHNYKPSALKDVLIFSLAFAATFILVLVHYVAAVLPYYYVVMWAVYSLYLVYFAWCLLKVGEVMHALGVTLAMVAGLFVACIYDFYRIPGDDTLAIFLTIALTSWSYMMVQVYYSYGALERAKGNALAR